MRRMVNHTSVIHVSLCYTHRFCVKLTKFLNLADSEYLHICESPESVRSILCLKKSQPKIS
jgi:hypothetical protein